MRRLAALALLLALCAPAAAEYPDRPVRLIIPFPPGGSNDVVGRLVANQLSEKLGHKVFVDNRGGAGGVLGTEAAASGRARRLHAADHLDRARGQSGALQAQLRSDQILHADLDHGDRAERAGGQSAASGEQREGAARARQGRSPASSITPPRASAASSISAANCSSSPPASNLQHVPYKGGGPAMQDVIAGHVKVMFSSLVQTTPFIQSGQLRALGTGGAKRNPVLPDVPTIAEAGVPGYVADNWWGIVAPAGTPQEIVDRLYKDIQAVLMSPELKAAFDREGAAAVTMTYGGVLQIHRKRNREVGARREGRQHQGAVTTWRASERGALKRWM